MEETQRHNYQSDSIHSPFFTHCLYLVLFQSLSPICRQKIHHPVLCMNRIYPICQTFTSTGRVALHEPNIQVIDKNRLFLFCVNFFFLQNIPKEFDIDVTSELLEKALGKDQVECLSTSSMLISSLANLVTEFEQRDKYSVSLRKAFVPS